jgi:AcrR family transcriptional regulator
MPSSSVPDSMAAKPAGHARATQAERRTRTREALLESAAHGVSRYGYGHLVLEQVARDAGLTRGARYHLFDGKDDLALASVAVSRRPGTGGSARPSRRSPTPPRRC